MYGIYDLSGGAYEYVATYYNGSISNNMKKFGSSFAIKNGKSTRYATAYTGTSMSEYFIIGDATYETSAWNEDMSSFIESYNLFFQRGGNHSGGATTGIFDSNWHTGDVNNGISFRVCLI